MIRFVIDDKSAIALCDWFSDNQKFVLESPFFYKKVRMEMHTKPCGSIVTVEAGKKPLEATFRVRAEQLSFLEDAKRMLNGGSSAVDVESVRHCINVYKKKEEYQRRTVAKFSFQSRGGIGGLQFKLKRIPSYEEYCGFKPEMLFGDLLTEPKESIDWERYLYDSYQNSVLVMKDCLRHFAEQYQAVFFAANAFLFYCNKDPDRYIRANTRTENGDKIIVFSVLPDSENDNRGGLYAVDVSGRESVDKDTKIVAVRGHLRRYESAKGHWKSDKVIWIDSFFRGTGAHKKASKEPREDFTKEDPSSWIPDVSEE